MHWSWSEYLLFDSFVVLTALSALRWPRVLREELVAWRTAIVLFAAALVARLVNLDYNGPYIDESSQSLFLGADSLYNAGNPFVWQSLSYVMTNAFGVVGGRGLAALLGAATVVVAWQFARCWLERVCMPCPAREQVALLSACVFAVSLPSLLTSRMATYHGLAFLFFTSGVLSLLGGARRDSAARITAGVALVAAGVFTRYQLSWNLPWVWTVVVYEGLRARSTRGPVVATLTLLAFFALYFAFYGGHVQEALDQAQEAVSENPRTTVAILSRLAWIAGPLLLASAFGILHSVVRGLKSNRVQALEAALVALGIAVVPLLHLYIGASQTMEKNLVFSVFLAAPYAALALKPSGVPMQRAGSDGPRMITVAIAVVALVAILTHSRHRLALEQSWADWRPVVAAVYEERLECSEQIWCTAAYTGTGNVWLLRRELGGRVDIHSPWYDPDESDGYSISEAGVFECASQSRIPLLIGPVKGTDHAEGDRVGPYVVRRVISVPHGPPAYLFALQ